MGAKDYYEILGVTRAESLGGIRNAYRNLAKECHPDRAGLQGKEKFQEIQEAYEVLSDPGKRREHDANLDRRGRIRGASSSVPEPLVPSHHRSRVISPEPFIKPSSPLEEIVVSKSSPRSFSVGIGSHLEPPYPFGHGFESVEREFAQVLMSCLRAFRTERF